MKYLIAGSGATGGSIGAFLAAQGQDVTFLARGTQLKAIKETGISMKHTAKGDFTVYPVKAMTMEEYQETPDVIFVCVKGYSLDDAVELIRRTASKETVIIPILNIYGTGERMQKLLPGITVTDGCIYVAAHVSAPGEITHGGDIFRVVYGLRPGQEAGAIQKEKLAQVKKDLDEAGIFGDYTDHVKRDTFKKFTYVGPMAAAGEYFHAQSGDFQKEGEPRETFIAMDRELQALAKAMNLGLQEDIVEANLKILDDLSPEAGTSMQRDIAKGGKSEIQGLVYAVEEMAEQYGAEIPVYRKIIQELKARGLK